MAASSHTIKAAKRRSKKPDKTSYLARTIAANAAFLRQQGNNVITIVREVA
jgi:hypothetical protein